MANLKTQQLYFDGALKMRMDDMPAEAWRIIAGPQQTGDVGAAFQRVPWIYRGVQLIAGAVASMPFAIYRGETEFDSSDNWQNRIKTVPNPRQLLWQISASLTLTGRDLPE